MKTTELDYHLPERLIAQHSVTPRDSSKLLVFNRATQLIEHRVFRDIVDYLQPGDLLVFNNSKVFRARLHDISGVIEIFLLRPRGNFSWECLGKPGKKLQVGDEVVFEKGVVGIVEERFENGRFLLKFSLTPAEVIAFANEVGEIPIPPYVAQKPLELKDYQTVYAKHTGSVAAPTAGFHFTERLFAELAEKNIETAEVTLHVGIGTFQPIKSDTIEEHEMHFEWAEISVQTAEAIARTKARGGRVIAVGTTTVRALEGLEGRAGAGDVNIFINPGYQFKIIDVLVTNFHLPRSTLMLLVSAFLQNGYEIDGLLLLKYIYGEAIDKDYRFYSFGDAMLVL
jgi:S-adenosylmethionine:tRNA ribosyltransferase-isomerase